MRLAVPLLLLAFSACGPSEPGVQPATEIIREVGGAMRPKMRVQVSIKAGAEEPGAEDLELRRRLEEQIEQENIGRLVSSGAGAGQFDVTVEVENTAEAIPRIQAILRSMNLERRASFRVIPAEER
ncbi:MAG TPA: hypothetical protein VNA04_18480 [Thermoanaerobaculia bacterium]|nr:hypothetical protein [Thermoanaerobaculia bacterium]